MNLQALFDLKERLEHAAIAGTNLLQEDFRMRRAVETLAPLANVNPVFAKICAGAKGLLNAPESERSTKLLDVLSLVDAVVYTQGVTNVSGEMLPVGRSDGSYVQASYGQLHPLLSALRGSGSGRMTLIREYRQSHPEFFRDFRILPHVLNALGDNYTELAELMADILMQQGESVIPLLKAGFDPAGKMDMTRRVRLITKIAGENENDWYGNALPESQKNVREALIQALSLSQHNARLLLDLSQSERGKMKEAALRSLAFMQNREAEALWQQEIQKKPKLLSCLNGVDSAIAADICAEAMRAFLEQLLAEKKAYSHPDAEQIIMFLSAFVGKYSPKVDTLWRWIAGKMDAFAAIVKDKQVYISDMSVAEHLQRIAMLTVLWNPGSEVRALAKDLAEQNREWFLGCAMLADMAELSSEALYEKYAPVIVREGLFRQENDQRRKERIQILRALSAVYWDPQDHVYKTEYPIFDRLTGAACMCTRDLKGLDPRWIQLLTDPKVKLDGEVYDFRLPGFYRKLDNFADELMFRLVDRDDPQIRELAASWIHQRILEKGSFSRLIDPLELCRWKNWRGMLVGCAKKRGEIGYAEVMILIRRIPMTNLEKAAELRELNELAQSGKIKISDRRWSQENISRFIAALEIDPNATI